jgi:hypothetical protein
MFASATERIGTGPKLHIPRSSSASCATEPTLISAPREQGNKLQALPRLVADGATRTATALIASLNYVA